MNLDYRFLKVLDDKNVRRRFRASNYQSTTRVKPFICTMPMRLDEGWNQIQFNLSDFTRRAYGTNYIETLRVQVKPRKQSIQIKTFFRFTQTVASVVSTSPIVCTVRTSYPPSSSSTCPYRTKQHQRHKYTKRLYWPRSLCFQLYSKQ